MISHATVKFDMENFITDLTHLPPPPQHLSLLLSEELEQLLREGSGSSKARSGSRVPTKRVVFSKTKRGEIWI
jgi:hypothetical protein